MILVDKDIKKRVHDNQLIIAEYNESNVNSISYDLTLDIVCDKEGKELSVYELSPGETVFVKTLEKLKIPDDILGRIAEKNSRMRQGLVVAGPHYQPGHITYAFLRVSNISEKVIELSKGMKIAQIIFEQLSSVPDVPYSSQISASYQNEVSYRGLGNYKEEYEKQTKARIQDAKEDIDSMSQRIYANVLTLMGVLVAVFSLLTINYQAFSNAKIDISYVLIMNLSMTLCVAIMLGLIFTFVNKMQKNRFLKVYVGIVVVLAVAVGVACMVLL